MDKIPDKEFMEIFSRSTEYINFKDAWTAEQIDGRMKNVQKAFLKLQHKSKQEKTKRYWRRKQLAVKKLRDHEFPAQLSFRAMTNRKSLYFLTMAYGYKAAKQKLLRMRSRNINVRRGHLKRN